MTHYKLSIKPGIVRDTTDYSNQGGWWDCQWVRFRNGFPEKIGGWQQYSTNSLVGPVRALHRFSLLDGTARLAIGTRARLYVERGARYQDVTPLRTTLTGTLGFTNGSTTATITFGVSHGAANPDVFTIQGYTNAGGAIAASALNYNTDTQLHWEVDSAASATVITFTLPSAAAATTTEGSITVKFLMQAGALNSTLGSGWGAGGWGEGPFGVGTSGGEYTINSMGTWSLDNFGEDLIANYRYNTPYYWDASTPTDRAIPFTSLSGASNAPVVATKILVSDIDRHVVACGVNPIGSSALDPMLVRWSDQEDAADWTPTTTNTSGDIRLDSGTKIITAVKTRQEIIIFTNAAVYSMQYIGGIETFSVNRVAQATRLYGWNAVTSHIDTVYWMAMDGFYTYSGQIEKLDCPIEQYILRDINLDEKDKVYAGLNTSFNEIWWLYPSGDNTECDKYVVYNYKEKLWYYGSLSRTAWLDEPNNEYCVAARYDSATDRSKIYNHEIGLDDYTTNSPAAISSYILSGPIEIGDGDKYLYCDKVLHDVSFLDSTASPATIGMKFYTKRFPMALYNDTETVSPGRNATQYDEDGNASSLNLLIEQGTTHHNIRLRGRQVAVKVSSNAVGVGWRLGVPRLNVRPDGRK